MICHEKSFPSANRSTVQISVPKSYHSCASYSGSPSPIQGQYHNQQETLWPVKNLNPVQLFAVGVVHLQPKQFSVQQKSVIVGWMNSVLRWEDWQHIEEGRWLRLERLHTEFAFSSHTKPLPVDSLSLMQSSTAEVGQKRDNREADLTRVVLVSPLVAFVNCASDDACNLMLFGVVIASFVMNMMR